MSARNRGAFLLAQTGATQAEIGAVAVASQQLAQRWLAGTAKPVRARRDAIRARWGVPVEAWDEALPDAPPEPTPPAATRRARTVDELHAAILAEASKELDAICSATDMTPAERARSLAKVHAIVDAERRRELRLVKSREWIALREKLVSVVQMFTPQDREMLLRVLDEAEEGEAST